MTRSKTYSQVRVIEQPQRLYPETVSLRWVLLGISLIAFLVCIIYRPALHGGFLLDDELLTQNKLIKASDGLQKFWFTTQPTDYWPVTSTSFWLEWRLWDGQPTGYHITNLVLHVIDSLLIWLLLRRLAIPGAFLAAVIFAVHPVNVESVAWIAQQKNLLALLFMLLSTLCYLMIEQPLLTEPDHATRPSHAPWYLLSLLLFVLGVLSKGSAVVLPALLLLIVWWRRPLSRWDFARMSPFFVVGALLAFLNIWFQTHGADAIVRNVSSIDRLLGAGAVIWFYLFKALLPINLVFIYPQWNIDSANFVWLLPLLAGIIVTVLLAWRRKTRFGRPLWFAWLFYCISLAPVMGFTDVGFMQYSLVADHYQHIAIIAIVTLIAASLLTWRESVRKFGTHIPDLIAVFYVAALTILASQQSQEYRDPVNLYETTLSKNPACWLAHNNLGNLANNAGCHREAIEHFRESLELKPDQPKVLSNLGAAQIELGRTAEGFDSLKQALKLDPNLADAEYNWGVALRKMGRSPEAIQHLQRAVDLKQDNAQHFNNLGQVLLETGQSEAAIKNLEKARQLDPDDVNSSTALAIAYEHAGRPEDALREAEHARELARSQHQAALADQIQAWINKLSAQRIPSSHNPAH